MQRRELYYKDLGFVGDIVGSVTALANVGVGIANAVSANKRANQQLKKNLEMQDAQIAMIKSNQRIQEQQAELASQAQRLQLEKARADLAQYHEALQTAKADAKKRQIAEQWAPWVGTFVAHEKIINTIGSAFGGFDLLISRVLGREFITDIQKKQIDFILALAGRVFGSFRQQEIPINLLSVLTELVDKDFRNNNTIQSTKQQLEYLKDGTFTLGKIYNNIISEGGRDKYKRAVQFGLFAINTNNNFSQIAYAPTEGVKTVTIAYTDAATQVTYEQVRDARKNLIKRTVRVWTDEDYDVQIRESNKKITQYNNSIAAHGDKIWQRREKVRDMEKIKNGIDRRVEVKGKRWPPREFFKARAWRNGYSKHEALRKAADLSSERYNELWRFIGEENIDALANKINEKINHLNNEIRNMDSEKDRWIRERSNEERFRDSKLREKEENRRNIANNKRLADAYFGVHKRFFGDSYFFPVFINQEQFERDLADEDLLGLTDVERESGKRGRRLYFALHRVVEPIYENILNKIKSFKDYSAGMVGAPALFRNDSEIKYIIKSLLVTDSDQLQNQQVVSDFLNSLEDAVRKSKFEYAFSQGVIPKVVQALLDQGQEQIVGYMLEFLVQQVLPNRPFTLYQADNQTQELRGGVLNIVKTMWDNLKNEYNRQLEHNLQSSFYRRNDKPWKEIFYETLERLQLANPMGLFNIADVDYSEKFAIYLDNNQKHFITFAELEPEVAELGIYNLANGVRTEGFHLVVPNLAHAKKTNLRMRLMDYAKLIKSIPVPAQSVEANLQKTPQVTTAPAVPVSNEGPAEPANIPPASVAVEQVMGQPVQEQVQDQPTRAGFKFSWLLLAGMVGVLLFNRKYK